LPTAAEDHQTANARALDSAGAAQWVPESKLTAASLSTGILGLLADSARLSSMRAAALRRAQPDATRDIVTRILTLLPPQ
jgi:UDP-N-acetylglucosamine--N-acetylmuramyl-(pentapeptide) pyrophosphoryl-undecaprenol N-acetylglucosamine transferase